MVRRSAGFVSKKPHRKSRAGCLTCKRKKVKCDEGQPACGYCALRKLDCEYRQETTSRSPSSSSVTTQSTSPTADSTALNSLEFDFSNTSTQIPSRLTPAAHTATGQLAPKDFELLYHYKTVTWRSFVLREDPTVIALHRDLVPNLSISANYLLYCLLSIAASQRNKFQPCNHDAHLALAYRQKAFQEYTKVLENITSENYETVLVTATLLLALVPVPDAGAGDEALLDWMHGLLKMTEGLRILASLRWSQGIEKLSIYPLIRRELRVLPPPPLINVQGKSSLHTIPGPLGSTPDHPNPPPTYNMPCVLPLAGMVFLPPSLLALLENMVTPQETGPIDLHRNALIPVFHALSPIFLSLYYYHLNSDFFVRILVFPSFLMPEFLALVKYREPRALAVVSWWFAMAGLVPRGWWIGDNMMRVVNALGNFVRQSENNGAIAAVDGVSRMMELYTVSGREDAARSVFDGWQGVRWEDGPTKAEEWERNLWSELDICSNVDDVDGAGLDHGMAGLGMAA